MRPIRSVVVATVAIIAACRPASQGSAGTTFTNVAIIDGTGSPTKSRSVRIVADTIVAVGYARGAERGVQRGTQHHSRRGPRR